MNISIKQLSKRVSLVALLSLPFSATLEAAGWFDAVRNSRIGQWFSEQPKAAQIGIAVASIITVACAANIGYTFYDGYIRPQPARLEPIGEPIDLNTFGISHSSDYSIHVLGSPENRQLEQDIQDLSLILSKERDQAVCSEVDFALVFPHDPRVKAHFTQEQIGECASSKNLRASIDFPWYLWGLKNQLVLRDTDVYIMRDAQQEFVGFVMAGKEPRANDRNFALFVKQNFRSKGCAKRLVLHAAQELVKQGETTINFYAEKNNPICRWYDKFGFTRAEAKPRGCSTELYEYAGRITNGSVSHAPLIGSSNSSN